MIKVKIPKKLVKQLKTQSDAVYLLVKVFGEFVHEMLESEMDKYHGYADNDLARTQPLHNRNGKSDKTFRTSTGQIIIDIPWEQGSSFDSIAVPKHEYFSQKVEGAI